MTNVEKLPTNQADPEILIEKNIPFPDMGNWRKRKYPFPDMGVGDSLFLPDQTASGPAAVAARLYAKKSGRKICSRSVDGGVRIWRIE